MCVCATRSQEQQTGYSMSVSWKFLSDSNSPAEDVVLLLYYNWPIHLWVCSEACSSAEIEFRGEERLSLAIVPWYIRRSPWNIYCSTFSRWKESGQFSTVSMVFLRREECWDDRMMSVGGDTQRHLYLRCLSRQFFPYFLDSVDSFDVFWINLASFSTRLKCWRWKFFLVQPPSVPTWVNVYIASFYHSVRFSGNSERDM